MSQNFEPEVTNNERNYIFPSNKIHDQTRVKCKYL